MTNLSIFIVVFFIFAGMVFGILTGIFFMVYAVTDYMMNFFPRLNGENEFSQKEVYDAAWENFKRIVLEFFKKDGVENKSGDQKSISDNQQ